MLQAARAPWHVECYGIVLQREQYRQPWVAKGDAMRGDQNGLGRDRSPDGPLPNLPRGFVVIGVLVLIGASLLLTMFYTVEADEVAVVQRFGKYVRREEPGLRTKLPLGLETVRKVKVQRVFKVEFGFRTEEPGVRTRFKQARSPRNR